MTPSTTYYYDNIAKAVAETANLRARGILCSDPLPIVGTDVPVRLNGNQVIEMTHKVETYKKRVFDFIT